MATDRPRFAREIEVEGSDLVQSVQYDNRREVLDVTLHGGKRYRYRGVQSWQFAELVTSRSAGKVFNQIKSDAFVSMRRLPSA